MQIRNSELLVTLEIAYLISFPWQWHQDVAETSDLSIVSFFTFIFYLLLSYKWFDSCFWFFFFKTLFFFCDPICDPVRDPIRDPIHDPVRDPVVIRFVIQSGPILVLSTPDLQCCGVDVFFNAVMRWIKSQLTVLQWSQTLRCEMFVFFMLRCSVKWNNCLRFWGVLIYLSQT